MDILNLITDVGFPITGAAVSGYFVFLTLKFILAGVTNNIKQLSSIVTALDSRIKAMNNEILRVDLSMSNALGVKPDTSRVARAEPDDNRKD